MHTFSIYRKLQRIENPIDNLHLFSGVSHTEVYLYVIASWYLLRSMILEAVVSNSNNAVIQMQIPSFLSDHWRIVHWKDRCWSWNSNTLATSCEEPTHWKRPWCWEGLGAGGEGDVRWWDGWISSLTQWTWVWVDSWSWWWTGRPGLLWFMAWQRVRHDWVTELNRTFIPEEIGFFCWTMKKFSKYNRSRLTDTESKLVVTKGEW